MLVKVTEVSNEDSQWADETHATCSHVLSTGGHASEYGGDLCVEHPAGGGERDPHAGGPGRGQQRGQPVGR